MITFRVYFMSERVGEKQRAYVTRPCGFAQTEKGSPQYAGDIVFEARNVREAIAVAHQHAPKVFYQGRPR